MQLCTRGLLEGFFPVVMVNPHDIEVKALFRCEKYASGRDECFLISLDKAFLLRYRLAKVS